MKARNTKQPPEILNMNFNTQEISLAIEKLNKRIEDVKQLNLDRVGYDSERVKTVERAIVETIRETFGEKSSQFRIHEDHDIWHGGYNMGDDDHERQCKYEAGIPETIIMLEGLINWLNEKRSDLEKMPKTHRLNAISEMDIHPRIITVCGDLYRDGHYGNAVFEASKALINYVKEKSRRHDLDGADLMRTVFSKKCPVLAFNDLSDQSDLDEQEGMMHLYEGAVLGIRNPRGHSFLNDSPERALEYVALISLLASRVDEAKVII